MSADLRALQTRFYALVTAPEGVEAGLRALGSSPAELEGDIRGDDRLSAVARLDLYANMYFYRILDVLRDEYAKLVAVVGDAAFHNLVTDYLVACRPAHPSLRDVGRRFAGFLRAHANTAPRPWLAELAELERARLEVFDAADAEPLTVDALRATPPDALAAMEVRRIPACHDFATTHAVELAWQALARGAAAEPVVAERRRIVVWRQGADVWQRALEAVEDRVWDMLGEGVSIGVLCEALATILDEEAVVPEAFRLLGSWATDGLLTRV